MNARDDIQLNGELVELHNLATADKKRAVLESLEAVRRSLLDWADEVREFDPPQAAYYGELAGLFEEFAYCVEQVRRPGMNGRQRSALRRYLANDALPSSREPAALLEGELPEATILQLARQVAQIIRKDKS